VCGIGGFKDFWPDAIAASLRRPSVWAGDDAAGGRPARIDAVIVELPGVTDLRNLNALDLAGLFDNPRWRSAAFDTMARAIERAGGHRGAGRIAFPAVLGLQDHVAAFVDAFRFLPQPLFEVPLVSPSVPGVRLYNALRAALRRRGGRMVIGEPVASVAIESRRVTSVSMTAAVRERVIRTNGLVLATGGIAGGGLVGRADGRLVEPILDLPVEAPPAERWLADDAFDPAGHPLEAAGIRTDGDLRPVDAKGRVVLENVAVVGSMLAGQRYLVERCGDGVAIASGQRAAATLGAAKKRDAADPPRGDVADPPATRRQRAGVRR
jgi:glycerol-3-phosphate dehydrogenase subunit B